MLGGIPHILFLKLLKILCEMGHNDRTVIADGNFPAKSMGRDVYVIHVEGHGMSEIPEIILSSFPLDVCVGHPVRPVSVTDGDTIETPIWNQYMTLVEACDSRGESTVGYIERLVFYEEVEKAYATIATSEKALYVSIMLQEGVVTDQGL